MHLSLGLSSVKVNWKCPDWRNYKVEHPILVRHVKRLQALGLKDPWVRNYAWIYSPNVYRTPLQLCTTIFFKRFPHGFALAVAYTFAQSAFLKWYNDNGYGEAHAH
uniref:NADH dehydrogenase [ubiquinone] 1 beta subcomplex subunit 3 n=2 Tax=Schistocephalus solidus TaxID=70667 RepID=A0A0X3QBH6_SCHSO